MKTSVLRMSLFVLAVLLLPFTLSEFGVYLAAEIFVMAIFAISLGFIMGYAGLISLGHAAFFAIGAYTVAMLGSYISNFYILVLTAVVISGIVAMLTGTVFIRTSHFYFLMITFAFGQLMYVLAWQLKPWTGGADGKSVSVPIDFGFGEIYDPIPVYFVMAFAFLFVYMLLHYIVNSPAGKIMKGVMQNESRMNSLGYNVRLYKILAYTIAGALCGFAGALYAYYNSFVSPDLTHWMNSGIALLMVIIGGAGTLFGPFLGAGVFILLKNFISTYSPSWHLIMGAILVVLVIIGRGGIIHWFDSLAQKLSRVSQTSVVPNKPNFAEEMKPIEHTEDRGN